MSVIGFNCTRVFCVTYRTTVSRLYHGLVQVLPRPGTSITTAWYKYYHVLVQVLPRAGTSITTCWYKYYQIVVISLVMQEAHTSACFPICYYKNLWGFAFIFSGWNRVGFIGQSLTHVIDYPTRKPRDKCPGLILFIGVTLVFR